MTDRDSDKFKLGVIVGVCFTLAVIGAGWAVAMAYGWVL